MLNLLKGLLLILFSLFCIYLLEGACFRLVDGYANWRLSLAWGKPSQPAFNSILKKIPLDHFIAQPLDSQESEHLGYWVGRESEYSSKIMSFTRPLRDMYKDFIYRKIEPLANFEIRDYDDIQGVVLPGLKKSASVEDVQKQKARRVGDGLEYAKGIFIKVIVQRNSDSYRQEFKDLETSFSFLLERGFACLVLPVVSSDDLVDKITRFQEQEGLLAKNLFGWADGKAATFLMQSCQTKPDCWKAIMLTDPEKFVKPPNVTGLPWTYFVIDDDRRLQEQGLDLLNEWIKLARTNENLYASRLSGLLRIGKRFNVDKTIPSYFVTYALFCAKFIDELHGDWPEVGVFSKTKFSDNNQSNLIPKSEVASSNFDLNRIEKRNNQIEEEESLIPTSFTANFDCEMVRVYRANHSNDPQLPLVTNRDLILKLGLGFEEMGQGVLEQIGVKDPLFYRYYNSLRAMEESPLH